MEQMVSKTIFARTRKLLEHIPSLLDIFIELPPGGKKPTHMNTPIMENSEATIPSASPIMTSGQASAGPEPRMDSLPYDLTFLIFQRLSVCCRTCLGVTCKTLYKTLKKEHPRPIHLHQKIECIDTDRYIDRDDEHLGYFLQDWSGLSHYRLCMTYPDPKHPWLFLSKEFYGETENSEAEQKMRKRWWDYFQSPSIGKNPFLASLIGNRPFSDSIIIGFIAGFPPLASVPYFAGHPTRAIHKLVPKPFGISGKDWTEHMIEVIKDDLECWDDWHEFWDFWAQTWVLAENWRQIEPIEELRLLWLAVDSH